VRPYRKWDYPQVLQEPEEQPPQELALPLR